jgi:hypothetical protein
MNLVKRTNLRISISLAEADSVGGTDIEATPWSERFRKPDRSGKYNRWIPVIQIWKIWFVGGIGWVNTRKKSRILLRLKLFAGAQHQAFVHIKGERTCLCGLMAMGGGVKPRILTDNHGVVHDPPLLGCETYPFEGSWRFFPWRLG